MVSVYDVVEKARKSGKVDKGVNETTKAVERSAAKLVVYATDVNPKEIVQHLPILCKEKSIKCVQVDSRQKLGLAIGIGVSCAAVAIIDAGDASKDIAVL